MNKNLKHFNKLNQDENIPNVSRDINKRSFSVADLNLKVTNDEVNHAPKRSQKDLSRKGKVALWLSIIRM